MHAPAPSTLAIAVLSPLLAWRIYARFRRMVGRQKLVPARPWITLALFTAVLVWLTFAAHTHVERLGWLAAGLTAGSLLGVYGLRLTRFEAPPQGLFYTPNAHLGIALSLLFVGRILYRMVELQSFTSATPPNTSNFAKSPLTLATFGLLAGYYISYALGLIRWRSRVLRAEGEHDAPGSQGEDIGRV